MKGPSEDIAVGTPAMARSSVRQHECRKGDADEAVLLRDLAEGNDHAFKILYQRYYKTLVYFGYKLVHDLPQAEDLVTEAFIRLWNNRQKLKSESHIKSYLFLSVRHDAVDLLRSKKVHEKVHQELILTSPREEAVIERALAEATVLEAISIEIERLPHQCSHIVSHILFDGMSTQEVSQAMGISPKNVLNQKLLAIKKIRSALLRQGLLTLVTLLASFFS